MPPSRPGQLIAKVLAGQLPARPAFMWELLYPRFPAATPGKYGQLEREAWVELAPITQAHPFLVLRTIASMYNVRLGSTWPSVALLAHKARQSRASVFRSLDWLIENGWLLKWQPEKGKRGSNIYRPKAPYEFILPGWHLAALDVQNKWRGE